MPLYNLNEHSKNYRKTTASLWNYYRDVLTNPSNDNYNANPMTNSASFKYKSSITGKALNNNNDNEENNNRGKKKDLEIVVTLSLVLTWSQNCIFYIITHAAFG